MIACAAPWAAAVSASSTATVRAASGCGCSRKLHVGDDAQSAQGAREELGEVVAGDVLDDLAAGLGDRPVGQDDGDADDQVAHGPVAVAARPVGVRGDHTPDRGARLRSGGSTPSIWSEPASCSWRSWSFIPAWTLTTWSPGTCSMTSSIRAMLRTRSSAFGGLPRCDLRPAAARGDGEALAARELQELANLLDRARLGDEGGPDAVDGILLRRLAGVLCADDASAGPPAIRSLFAYPSQAP